MLTRFRDTNLLDKLYVPKVTKVSMIHWERG